MFLGCFFHKGVAKANFKSFRVLPPRVVVWQPRRGGISRMSLGPHAQGRNHRPYWHHGLFCRKPVGISRWSLLKWTEHLWVEQGVLLFYQPMQLLPYLSHQDAAPRASEFLMQMTFALPWYIRETEPVGCGTGKCKVYRAAWQTGNSVKSRRCSLDSKGGLEAESCPFRGTRVFSLKAFN